MERPSWIFSIERLAAKRGLTATLLAADGRGVAPHQRGAADASGIACCWPALAAANRSKSYAIVRCCNGTSEIVIPAGSKTLLIGPIKADGPLDSAVALIAEIAAERASAAAAVEATPLLGDTAIMHGLRASVSLMANSEASIVVLGENGTGKELVARQIHDQSARAAAPSRSSRT